MMDKLSEKLSVVKSNASEIAKLVEELSKKNVNDPDYKLGVDEIARLSRVTYDLAMEVNGFRCSERAARSAEPSARSR